MCQLVILCHPGLTYIFNFWHLGTLALRAERQSAQMSEIKNVGQTWMTLNNFKCNHLMPLHFKGLMCRYWTISRKLTSVSFTAVIRNIYLHGLHLCVLHVLVLWRLDIDSYLVQFTVNLIEYFAKKITRCFMNLTTSIMRWLLTPSTPSVLNCCCSKGPAPYWSNPPFLIFYIRALCRSVLSTRAPECQKLKMTG